MRLTILTAACPPSRRRNCCKSARALRAACLERERERERELGLGVGLKPQFKGTVTTMILSFAVELCTGDLEALTIIATCTCSLLQPLDFQAHYCT